MQIDHIFIFSNKKGKEAQDLVDFGFTEGSSRTHYEQGTTNRKFYFENFFLEILWVFSVQEIQNKATSKTKLWERSHFKNNGYSPYGLCLVNSDSTDGLFENSEIYQPNYFPNGMSIDIITNEQAPDLPWTFRLPYREEQKAHNEPMKHHNGIKRLTRVEFEIHSEQGLGFKSYFDKTSSIAFKQSNQVGLTLEFDNNIQGRTKKFSELGLNIKY